MMTCPQIREVATGEDLSDTLEFVKFSSMAWTHDHKGLFYNVGLLCVSFCFHLVLKNDV